MVAAHSRNCFSGCQRRRAFTLTELLAVVPIIALLIAMAAPSLEVTRQRSKQSVCMDRLRAISEASRVYQAQDSEGLIVPVHPSFFAGFDPGGSSLWQGRGAYEWGGKSGIGGVGAYPGFPSTGLYAFFSGKYGSPIGAGPPTRPLNAILYPAGFKSAISGTGFNRQRATNDTLLELDAYRCPADDGPPGGAHCQQWLEHPKRSAFDHFGNSYAANNMMASSGGEIWSNSPYLRPASRVPNPRRTLMYEESIGRWAWACKRESSDCVSMLGLEGLDPGPTKAVRGWHGKNWVYNRSFIDTHVETQAVYFEGTEDQDGYANHYRSEIVFPDDPDTQNSFVCVIIRGPGWQKDTLPSPGIPTGMNHGGWPGRTSYEGCVSP